MMEAPNLAVKRPLRRFKALGRSFTPLGRKNALRGPEGPPRAFFIYRDKGRCVWSDLAPVSRHRQVPPVTALQQGGEQGRQGAHRGKLRHPPMGSVVQDFRESRQTLA